MATTKNNPRAEGPHDRRRPARFLEIWIRGLAPLNMWFGAGTKNAGIDINP